MKYQLYYTKKALKELKKIKRMNKIEYAMIKKNITKLSKNLFDVKNINIKTPKCPKCKRMKSGNHRIIYYVHTKKHDIQIIRIIERKNNYREFK